jgi:DNA-binding YbaB/EbfC family protein
MAKGGFPGMGGNMQQLMKQAQKMQQDMQRVQAELEEKQVEASAGGGAVNVVVSCAKQLVSISISPEAVDPDDVEMLEDLVVAAVNEGLRKAEETASQEMAKVTGGLPTGGLF